MMWIGLMFCALAGVLSSVNAFLYSKVAGRGIDLLTFGMVLNAFATCLSLFLCNWPVLLEHGISENGGTLSLFIACGVFNQAGMLSLLYAMRHGHKAASWSMAQSAMVIPVIAGIAIWRNPVSIANGFGVLAILLGVFAFGRRFSTGASHTRTEGKWLILTLSAFISLGLAQTLLSAPSYWEGWSDTGRLRVPVLLFSSTVTLMVVCLVTGRRVTRQCLLWGIGSAFSVFGVLFFLVCALDAMGAVQKAAFVYPSCIGISITVFAVYSAVCLREPFPKIAIAGVASIVVGLGLLTMG